MESINKFLSHIAPKIIFTSGYKDKSGSGSGSGFGSGSGSGDRSGSGSGFGSGSGDRSGGGYIYKYGSGSGDGSLESYNGFKIYCIDSIPTIITNVKGNIAKGYILNKDLTLSECYIVKQDYAFAHGKTLKEARNSLILKLLRNFPIEERVKEFVSKFKPNVKYLAKMFYDWHHNLTGSCLFGRDNFCQNHNIDIYKDKLTVNEFIKLTENNYGSEVILQLKEKYKENTKCQK